MGGRFCHSASRCKAPGMAPPRQGLRRSGSYCESIRFPVLGTRTLYIWGRYANACRLTLSQDCRRHSKNDPLGRKIFKQLRFMRASGFPGFAICLICRFLVRSLSHCLVLVRLKTYSTFDSPKNCRDLCVQVTLFVVESPLYTSHTLPSLPRAP